MTTDRDELGADAEALSKTLRPLAFEPRPRLGLARPWLRPLVLALVVASLAFSLIAPAAVPPRLVGLFTDRPVTELDIRGGSWVDVHLNTVADPDNHITPLVAEAFRERGADVAFAGRGKLILEIPGLDPGEARRWARRISATEGLSMGLVIEDGWSWEDRELPPGVELRTDAWVGGEGGKEHLETFIESADLASLRRALPDGWMVGETGSGRWRSYAVAPFELDNSDIARARVVTDPASGQPQVLIQFTEDGAATFSRLTAANLGRKLAIVLGEEEVLAAPVIRSRIDGGRAAITLGPGSPAARLAEAEALVRVLDAPTFAAPVEIGSIEAVPAMGDSGAVLGGRALFAALLGLAAFAVAWPARRKLGLPDPDVAPLRGVARSRGALLARAGLTAVVAALAAAVAGRVLPGASHLVPLDPGSTWISVGVLPLLGGSVVVAVAGLAIPALGRALRHRRALATGLSLGAGLLLAGGLLAARMSQTPSLRAPAGLELLAGSLGLFALGWIASRHGIGNGFAAVLAGAAVPSLATLELLRQATPVGASLGLALYPLAAAAVAVAVCFVLRTRVRGRHGGPVRLIGGGIAALPIAAIAASLSGAGSLALAMPDASPLGLVALLVATAALGVVALRPRFAGGARVVSQPAAAGTLVTLAVVIASVGLVAGLALFDRRFLGGAFGPALLSATGVAVATAAALDAVADFRARWRNPELRRIEALGDAAAADSIAAALASAGIDVHLHNLHLRRLLGVAGAWADVEVWVPEHRAAEAGDIVRGQVEA